jgi:hypothetical protein
MINEDVLKSLIPKLINLACDVMSENDALVILDFFAKLCSDKPSFLGEHSWYLEEDWSMDAPVPPEIIELFKTMEAA